jgi:hypothetical protein
MEFEKLLGKTIKKIEGAKVGSESIKIYTTDDKVYMLYHEQGCCESVSVEDVTGNIKDLIKHPILLAEEVSNETNPIGVIKEEQDSFTWTFYKLSTIKGSVTIRWYGESNGYYSESVDFKEVKNII